jgi:filamentous hemagglutinin family protein
MFFNCKIKFREFAAAIFLSGLAVNAPANPTGLTVASGSASAQTSGSQLTITTGNSAVLNWQSFNIGAGETTIFNQPNAYSVVINNIHDANASQIYGSLQANGIVVLMNASGFYFGPNSFVKTGGLIVSTANCIPPQNTGGSWEFNGPPPLASIVNYGQLQVGQNGSVFLIADQVENHGTIEAPEGSIGLASGQTVLLSERPDGRGMSLQVTLPGGSVNNDGKLVADAGTISLQAKVVNQDGLIQANSVQNQNGVIELVASDSLDLGADSKILAQGDDSTGGSAGGNVTLKSENNFSDSTGGEIVTSGGANGGNGGNVEISAPDILSLKSTVDAGAQAGWRGGVFSLDPLDIVLGTSSSGPPDNNGTIDGSSGSGVFYVDVNNEFQNITAGQILLKASGNIYVGDGLVNSDGSFTPFSGMTWDLTDSAGGRSSGQLLLQASGSITFVDGSLITDANNWSVSLQAGYDFNNNSVSYGAGNIYLGGDPAFGGTGSGSIQTATGSIHLEAAQDILVGSGFVRTTGNGITPGGSITTWAHKGDVNTGTYDAGYTYNVSTSSSDPFYQVDQNLGVGGISTEAGGDVNITAGGNVTSFMPSQTDTTAAGTGAFGPQAGNVTVVAGGNVAGHFVVANGYGRIYAGVAKDSQGKPIVQTDSHGISVDEVDGSGNPILLGANGHVYARNAQGNPILLDSSGNIIPTTNVKVVSNGTILDASGNVVNAYKIEFTLKDGTEEDSSATAVAAYALNSSSSGSAGTGTDAQLALSLISGGWTVNAANNINLQEVRNPNGEFNNIPAGRFPPLSFHYFDYSPDAFVNLIAGNAVNVAANSSTLPRNDSLPVILPPIVNIMAGIGGVSFSGNTTELGQAILFPSPLGGLTITSAGDLQGSSPSGIYDLIVSDSGYHQFYNVNADVFGRTAHAATPIHLGSPTTISLGIAGDMDNVLLSSPEAAQILVGGDMINSRFEGMNLNPGDVTKIYVSGDIENRGEFTTADADQSPLLQYLSEVVPDSPDAQLGANLSQQIFYSYDPVTKIGTLTIQGLTDHILSVLQSLTVLNYVNGVLQYNPDGTPQIKSTPVAVIDAVTVNNLKQALDAQNAKFGAITSNDSGYILGGGGLFDIRANSIDLGTTLGIQSQGVTYDVSYPTDRHFQPIYDANGNAEFTYPLANYFTQGADIKVKTTGGDINMFSTSISSQNGGAININAADNVSVGSDFFTDQSSQPRGIFTTAGSDISVVAGGDIDVNGSRIAAFDGGNVTVESLKGNVNAGTGASSILTVAEYYVDPVSRAVYGYAPQIPFSGILALTFPARRASFPAPVEQLGNILVEAPNGSVNADVAGILQLPLNQFNYPDATTIVLAGYELRDSGNHPVTAANWADGTPVFVSSDRNIYASGSGVIASNAKLDASGSINGLIFARNNIDISAQQNVNVTALGGANVSVSSGGSISGTIIGVGGVTASGGSIDASLISANVTGGSSGQTGLGQGSAANSTSQAATTDDATKVAKTDSSTDDEDLKKKKGKGIALAQKVSRVTVLLPKKD